MTSTLGLVPAWARPLATVLHDVQERDLTRFSAPPGSHPRPASVLILFGADPGGVRDADADSDPSRDPAAGHGGDPGSDSGADPGGDLSADPGEVPDADADSGTSYGAEPAGHGAGHVLLLERAHDMRSHAGQVAFPGGSQDPADGDAVAAALREAEEETGLDTAGVAVLATLPALWLPPSNFAVTPVVAWWHTPSPVCAVDPRETASVHTVALDELLDPAHRVIMRHPSGHEGPAFLVRDLVVWGFTAGLLARIFTLVGWERPWDASRRQDLPSEMVERSLRDLDRRQLEP